MRSKFSALLAVLALVVVAGGAQAQSSGWTAPSIDYTGSSQAIVTQLGGVMTTVLPFAVMLLGLVVGFKWFFRLIRKGAGG